ncbi:MAG: adenylyl-sulfate kinase [Verrucomicrobiota bacterium]|nr:adenylyl-sulfate kinase [Verrucomicrobiota bacterium]
MNTHEILEQLKIVIVGHVDHGKSTFIGRLFYDTDTLPDGKYEQLVDIAKKRGVPFEFANLMDSLQAERDQNITVDTAQIWFRTKKRQYVIIDAPGHKEFLKNMITGAASADAAFLLIAANEGVQEQSRRHGYLLSLLGIKQVVVLVNKMDLVDYSADVFNTIEAEYRAFLKQIGVEPITFIPIAAREGLNVAHKSKQTDWYTGKTVLDMLDDFSLPVAPDNLPLRLPLQDVYRFDHRRILAGRVESGTVKVGDKLVFAPGHKTSVVKTIERWNSPSTDKAVAGESIGITLTEQIFVERGDVAMHEGTSSYATTQFEAKLFWMGRLPLSIGKKYKIKLTSQEFEGEVLAIHKVIDASNLSTSTSKLEIAKNDVAEVTIKTRVPVALDTYDRIVETGRFVIVDQREVAGGGIITGAPAASIASAENKPSNLTYNKSTITYEDRIQRNSHKGAVVWLTGLSGAGKSAVANEVEKELFIRGMHISVLDGDNLRFGLCSNLGFSPEDRSENIRRTAQAAKLLAETGFICLVSLISPYRSDRARAREIMTEASIDFIEVYVSTPLAECEKRDPKKLYQKARAGELKDFTGISAPYEVPEKPDLDIPSDQLSIKECAARVIDFVLARVEIDAQTDVSI